MTRSRAKTKVSDMTNHYKDAPCTAQPATAHIAMFTVREAPHCIALVAIWSKHVTLTSEGLMDRGEPGYAASRAKMLTYPEDFALASAFIAAGDLGPRSHGEFHSYALKHRVERWSRLLQLSRQHYVSNGAMIAAALAFGWGARRDGVNAWLNPSKKLRQVTAKFAPPQGTRGV